MDKAGAYDIFDGEKKVGQLDLSLLERFSSEYPGYPAGWVGKPVLEIDGLGIFDNTDNGGHGRGCGRFVLQECYKLAQKVSEGRIVVHATWGGWSFL